MMETEQRIRSRATIAPSRSAMHYFDGPPAPPKRTAARTICIAAIVILALPSLAVWVVRAIASGTHCAPGPAACSSFPVGQALRYSLEAAWLLGTHPLLCMTVALAGAFAGLWARQPLTAAMAMLILPIAVVLLPTLAVRSSLYPGCSLNEDGIGSCTLWGTPMGMNLHYAANASALIYGFAPYSVALALMILAVGLLFFRPRHA